MKLPSPHGDERTAPGIKYRKQKRKPLSVLEIVLFGLLSAILVAAQVALYAIPNIHITGVLLILYTKTFGKKAFFPLYAFVLLEGLIWGFGMWWFSYLYAWVPLIVITLLLKKQDSAPLFACVAAIFGLSFGTLTSLPYLFIGGPAMFVTTVIKGLSFDFIHCAGNFALTLLFYRPLSNLLALATKRISRE